MSGRLRRAARLTARLIGAILRPGRLSYLVLFVNDECNAKCGYCFNVRLPHLRAELPGTAAPAMSLAEYEALASRSGALTQVVLSGGEPFLREDLDRIVRAFYERSGAALFSIPTNGSLPGRALEKAGTIAVACPDATINLIVSLDAVGEKHDRLRGLPGGYEKALGLCRGILALRRRLTNLNLVVTTAVTEANIDDVVELRAVLLEALPAEGWHHNVQYDQRLGARAAGEPGLAEKVKAIDRAFEPRPGAGVWSRLVSRWYVGFINRLIQSQLQAGHMLYRCVAGDRLAVVLADGTLRPCEPFAFEKAYSDQASASLREHGFDIDRARQGAAFERSRRFIAERRCLACPWSCAATASMAYEPRNWRLLWKV